MVGRNSVAHSATVWAADAGAPAVLGFGVRATVAECIALFRPTLVY